MQIQDMVGRKSHNPLQKTTQAMRNNSTCWDNVFFFSMINLM
ncbi:hypothetical protein [Citrobacter freundii]|uniref:Uncharacterized protein n=1 Tax=Citrobacter freundii TaxID=546 RepID=A0A7G2IYK0_CITFR|nr:hypothetical protein [Citrobacter freundii]